MSPAIDSQEFTHSRQGERSSPESQMLKNFISRKFTKPVEHWKILAALRNSQRASNSENSTITLSKL